MVAAIKRDPKLFKAGSAKLEALYEEAKDDAVRLKVLAYELSHRETKRARRLHDRVKSTLSGLPNPQPELDLGIPREKPVPPPRSAPREAPDDDALTLSPARPGLDALPDLLDLGCIPMVALPDTPDHPAAILSAWTAIEALDPSTYRRPQDLAAGDPRRIVTLAGDDLPWPKGKPPPKNQLFYQVPLGAIRMAEATQALAGAFGENEELNPRQRERAIIAAVLVDRNGIPLDEDAIAVSSFAWALPEVLAGNVASLGRWSMVERRVLETLAKILRNRSADEDEEAEPLTRSRIERAHRWLVRQFGLDAAMVDPPSFVIRRPHHFKAPEPPKVDLLNSFFLRDLERARRMVSEGAVPSGLARYLGEDAPTHAPDLLRNRTALEAAVAPGRTPPIRWPSAGGHPLVLLQQAAVNLARGDLKGADGIVAVNGPPGTGKTTLLRDVVAGCLLDRARAMATFDDPEQAFKPSGQRMTMGQGFFHLYELDPSLCGHEILVASSNNKAVENVSAELPALGAVGRAPEELSYLRTLSDRVHAPPVPFEDRGKERPPPEETTWGMIAAVLGNAGNRFAFTQGFWWDTDRGFQTYLKAVQGKPVVREIRDEDGTLLRRETPAIVTEEQPPGPDEARRNWTKARKRFRAALRKAETAIAELEKVRDTVNTLTVQREALAEQQGHRHDAENAARRYGAAFNQARAACAASRRQVASTRGALQAHDERRPGLLARLLRTATAKAWQAARTSLLRDEAAANAAHVQAGHAEAATRVDHTAAEGALSDSGRVVDAMNARIAELEVALEPARQRLGNRLVDTAFFARGHEASNLSAPWIPDEVHRTREEVFVAAVALHKAFIDGAAQKIQHNLGVLMSALNAGSLGSADRDRLLPHLWSTLFCVVPVLSTTFASVDRMLGTLPERSIGWLLVDEAGQAVPQAAVGALLRARRAIVVGDPLQIPPVVTLPERLVEAIAKEFRIDAARWMPPGASAQTLADRASRHQGAFRGENGPRRVGIPLLVHRRCLDPMFDISNRIAYDGQMVHATQAPKPGAEGPVTRVLGRSRWFDVDGEAPTKWCPAEGDMAIHLLHALAQNGVRDPDLFIITPFRDIANGMRTRLREESDLCEVLNIEAAAWTNDRIGTVHTVQGREAETVILMLGAPSTAQGGARAWAAGFPNILNVAVSRARQSLYVIGSRGAWGGVGHARTLANALPSTVPRTRQ